MTMHFLPAISLTISILLILVVISFRRSHGLVYWLCGASLLSAALLQLMVLDASDSRETLFVFNKTNGFLLVIIFLLAALLWTQVYRWLSSLDEQREEYYLLILLATLGAWVIIASVHFASFFIGLELMSLSFIGLLAYKGSDLRGQEAGVKYLVLSGLASSLVLMGMALIYLQTGSLSFADQGPGIATGQLLPTPGLQAPWLSSVAIIFIVTGIFFKLSVAPCHLWLADIFEGAPLPSTALLATLSKLATFVVLWRLSFIASWHHNPAIMDLVALVAIASMLVGNFLGLLQKHLLRLLAFSSIAHFGYLLVIILLLQSVEAVSGSQGLLREAMVFYLASYMLTLAGVFSVLMQLPKVKTLEHLSGLFWHQPLLATTLAILIFSLAGIPLTIGFMGKFYLITVTIFAQMWWPLAALILGSVIGLFYYLRVILALFSNPQGTESGAQTQTHHGGNMRHRLLNLVIILLVIGIGTFPGPLSSLIQAIAE